MTDRNAIIAALTSAIMGKTAPQAAAAVLALVGPKPLVWDAVGDGKGRYRLHSTVSWSQHPYGPYFIGLSCSHGSDFSWAGPSNSGARDYPTLEAAQAAAQSHADATHWANTPLGDMIGRE